MNFFFILLYETDSALNSLYVTFVYSVCVKTVKTRKMQMAGHVGRMGESKNAYRILVGELLEK